MIAYTGMLLPAAKKAGMRTPIDPDDFNAADFPHFNLFCVVQIGKAVRYHGEHWHNAEVIARLTKEEIDAITLEYLIEKGLSY